MNIGINKIKTIIKENKIDSQILNGLKIGNEKITNNKIKNIQVNNFLFNFAVNTF
jgi:hypothetical protein